MYLVFYQPLSGGCQKKKLFQNFGMKKIFFFLINLLICLKQGDAQFFNNFLSNPGLFSYNALNLATGGLTEALTNGRQYFNNNQNEKTTKQPSNYQNRPNVYERNNYNSGSNFQQQSIVQETSSSCSSYFSFFRENNENFGTVVLQKPDQVRNVLKIELSLGAKLPSVRFFHLRLTFQPSALCFRSLRTLL